VAALACLVVRLLNLPRLFDLAFCLAMVLTGWGEAMRLYDAIGWYDTLVHTLVPFLGAPCVYIALARLDVVPDPADDTSTRHYIGMFATTVALGLALGAVWELAEWFGDGVLGSSLQKSLRDTNGDLLADAGGAVAGGLLLVVWARYGWGSVRRIPGENRAEQRQA
jgi:hypothetical protein